MTPEEKYELIERYLNHTLSQEERTAFDLNIKTDPDFASEFAAHKEVHTLVLDQGIINLKQKLRTIHNNELKSNSRSQWKPYLYGAAALIGLTATIGYFYVSNIDKPSNKEVSVVVQKNTLDTIASDKKNTSENNQVESIQKNDSDPSTSSQHTVLDNNTIQNVPKTVDSVKVKQPVIPVNTALADNTKKTDTSGTNKTSPAKIDCSTVNIIGEVNSSESCTDKSTGAILINLSSLKGGSKPYKFSISNRDEFKTGSQFSELPAGHYKVLVKDKNECISVLKEVEIKTKHCSKEYAFAPSRNETWEFPMNDHANGEIKISSRGGEIVYHAFISNGYPNSWNGTDNNGLELPMNVYMFVITYSNGEINQGYVTIMK